MSNPFVYYRLDSVGELRRDAPCAVRELDWRKDLAVIRRFYARFTDVPVNPDEFDRTVGSPLVIMEGNDIVSFAIPLSFHEGETEIGAVATVPERRNKGLCKALIAEMAFRILSGGKTATLTTERTNLPMQAAASAIGLRELAGNDPGAKTGETSGLTD